MLPERNLFLSDKKKVVIQIRQFNEAEELFL